MLMREAIDLGSKLNFESNVYKATEEILKLSYSVRFVQEMRKTKVIISGNNINLLSCHFFE